MPTLPTTTLTVTIDAPIEAVATDLADPATHPEWATEFFASAATPHDETGVIAEVPMMGGTVHFDIKADVAHGAIDLFLAPLGSEFGPPLPVRLLPNGDGVDVLWTLTRFPGIDDTQWKTGVDSMARELDRLRSRHEQSPV